MKIQKFRDQLSGHNLAAVYDHWVSISGAKPIPARRDIDPLQLPRSQLANLMLVDALRGPLRYRYRYRLVGTNIVMATGENRTGRFFDEVSFFHDYPAVVQQYDAVVELRQPIYSAEPFTNPITDATYEAERLLLPLSNDARDVDSVFVAFQFNTGPWIRP